MRRHLFVTLGLLELVVAGVLVRLGLDLPTGDDVRRGFDGVRQVSGAAGRQVRALREQVGALRGGKVRETADRLQVATRSVAETLKAQRVDFETVRTVRDALDRSAAGLGDLADDFDPEALARLGSGLGEAADFLDRGVVPAARAAADGLDAAAAPWRATAGRLTQLARAAPRDLQPIRAVHESLGRLDEALAAAGATLDPKRLAPIRAAAAGAEGVVDEAARMADRAGGYTYPVVEFSGAVPRVRARPFWPRGAQVGADLKKVAAGVAAMRREADALGADLPRLHAGLAESRKSLGATRAGLADALAHQAEVERLLKDLPEQADRLAQAFPKVTVGLAQALRATGRLSEVAAGLREARRGVDASTARWPEVRRGLAGSAVVLRAARDRMEAVLRNRRAYESARAGFEGLAAEFAGLLPDAAGGLAVRLDEEDRTLAEMAVGVDRFDAALPVISGAAARSLRLGRLLAWLVAATAGLHGIALVVGDRPWRTPSSPDEAR